MSLQFNSSFYLEQYPDVAAAGIDPQVHFENYGAAEGRAPNATLLPVAGGFDEQAYLDANSDVAAAVDADQLESGYQHWVLYGRFEDSRPEATFNSGTPVSEAAPASIDALFNADEYLELNPDVAEAGIDAYEHFVNYGSAEGRAPNAAYAEIAANFDSQAYLAANPDIDTAIDAGATFTPYQHWVLYGQFEASRPEATLTDGRTVSDVIGGEEAVAPTFRLTEGSPTDAAEASDAVASEYSVQANASQYANAETFSVTLPAAAEGDEPTEIEVDVSAVTGGASLATALNGNTSFSGAGLEASFSASNGTLTITDENGRTLNDIELIGAPESSTATVNLLESNLVGTEIVRLNIGGEQVELRGVTGTTGAEIATSVEGKLAAIEDAEGENPYANIAVEYDDANADLVITDNERRELSDLSLQSVTPSEVEINIAADEYKNDLNELQVAQLEITLAGETKLVDFSETPATLVTNIQTAFGLDGGIGVEIDTTTDVENVAITVTDAWGRDFGATQLLGDGDAPVPSETVVGPLAADDVGQFSVTIGSGSDAVTIEKAAVDSADLATLVTDLNTLMTNAGLTDVEVTAEGTDSIKITNNAGTGISNVYVGTALDTNDESSVEISGLTDVLAGDVASFEVQIGGQTYTLANAQADNLAEGEVDFSAVTTIEELTAKLQEALRAQETVTGRTDISVAMKDADDVAGTDSQTIVITDAAGRALSGVAMAGAEDADLPASATVSGLDENAVKLDLGFVEVKYNDANGAEQTVNVAVPENTFSAALPTIADLTQVQDGDTLTVQLDGDGVAAGSATFTAAGGNGFAGTTATVNGVEYTLSVDQAGTTATISADTAFGVVAADDVVTDLAARTEGTTSVASDLTATGQFEADLPAIADLADVQDGDTLAVQVDGGGTPGLATFTAAGGNGFAGTTATVDGTEYTLSVVDNVVTVSAASAFDVVAANDVVTDLAARTEETQAISNISVTETSGTFTSDAITISDIGDVAGTDTLSITVNDGADQALTFAAVAGVLDGQTATSNAVEYTVNVSGSDVTISAASSFTVPDGNVTTDLAARSEETTAVASNITAEGQFETDLPAITDLGDAATGDTLTVSIGGVETTFTAASDSFDSVTSGDYTLSVTGNVVTIQSGSSFVVNATADVVTDFAARGEVTEVVATDKTATSDGSAWTSVEQFRSALETELQKKAAFTVEAFEEDATLVITAPDGTEVTSVALKTGENGVSVIDGVAISESVEAATGVALDIGEIGTADNATTGAPVVALT